MKYRGIAFFLLWTRPIDISADKDGVLERIMSNSKAFGMVNFSKNYFKSNSYNFSTYSHHQSHLCCFGQQVPIDELFGFLLLLKQLIWNISLIPIILRTDTITIIRCLFIKHPSTVRYAVRKLFILIGTFTTFRRGTKLRPHIGMAKVELTVCWIRNNNSSLLSTVFKFVGLCEKLFWPIEKGIRSGLRKDQNKF